MKRFLIVPLFVGLLLMTLPWTSVAWAQEATDTPETGPEARIVVTALTVEPREVEPGQDAVVTAEARNIGDAAGSQSLELLLDGTLVQSLTVTLDPSESQKVAFTSLGGGSGTHVVALGTAQERYTVGAAPEQKFRLGPVVRLRPLNDEITTAQDGLVEVFVSNPAVNDIGVVTEMFITVPSGIHVYGESFGQAAAAGTVRGLFDMPPGSSRTIPIYIKAEKVGKFFVHFSGHYWPEGNKDGFQPISLTTPMTVTQPSPNPTDPDPTNPEQVQRAKASSSGSQDEFSDGAGRPGEVTIVQPKDKPWYREPLFFVIAALAGAALIVGLGKTVITMS